MKIDHREIFQNCLAAGTLIVCFTYFFWISSSSKATNNQHIGEIKILCASAVTLVLQYFFGSSKGGQRNSETIRQLINPPEGTTTVSTKSPTLEGVEAKKEEAKKDETIIE